MSSANDVDSKYRITNKYDKNIVRFYDNFHSLNLRFQIDNLLKLKVLRLCRQKPIYLIL